MFICKIMILSSLLFLIPLIACQPSDETLSNFFQGHTNNWAVLVCTSRYWFNYRHMANTLSVYHSVKRLGIPDSHIILMLSEDMACDPRNPHPSAIYGDTSKKVNLYGQDVQIDYKGYEVNVENFFRVLTGRFENHVPRSKRLLSDESSNVLVYLSGHGGDQFLKFQDSQELLDIEVADTFQQMWEKGRYHELLFLIDTCQANTMFSQFYSPNIVAAGSSARGEDSYSYELDPSIGVHLMDRWTFYLLQFLETVTPYSKTSLGTLFRSFKSKEVRSTPGVRYDLFPKSIDSTPITDFFGSSRRVSLHDHNSKKSSSNLPSPKPRVKRKSDEENQKVERKDIETYEDRRDRYNKRTMEKINQVFKNSKRNEFTELEIRFLLAGSLFIIVTCILFLAAIWE